MGKLRQAALILGEEPERSQYQKLKAKYAKPIDKPKKGIYCEVEFFETHRCTELFFLYYFRYTSRPYETQEPIIVAPLRVLSLIQ